MEISFTLGVKDYKSYAWRQFFRTPRLLLTSLTYLSILCAIVYWMFRQTSSQGETITNVGVIALIYILIVWTLSNSRVKKRYRQSGALYGHKIALSEEGLTVTTHNASSTLKWNNGIVKIEETRKFICFYIARNSAFLVPKSAFKSGVEREMFLEEARGYWTANHEITAV